MVGIERSGEFWERVGRRIIFKLARLIISFFVAPFFLVVGVGALSILLLLVFKFRGSSVA